jgi:hypothetical protein
VGGTPAPESLSVYKAERSRGRMVALIVGGVIVIAAAAAVAVSLLGGSSSKKSATVAVNTSTTTGVTHAKSHLHKATPKLSPAETTVAVLNATETEGLAHRTASALQQNGYSQATALSGKPPGSSQVSVVEYAGGHQPEAEGVARSMTVTHVLPVEAAVTALAGSANVVVIVGADKASQSP